jgi:hypothetical protein
MGIYLFAAQGGERFISGLKTGVFSTPAPQRYKFGAYWIGTRSMILISYYSAVVAQLLPLVSAYDHNW